ALVSESGLESEGELYRRALEFWMTNAPPAPEVDLSNVQTAADLLALVSAALRLPGPFGNNLDAFGEGLIRSIDLPSKLSLNGWDRVAKQMPRDAEFLLECFRELGRMYPECAIEIDCR